MKYLILTTFCDPIVGTAFKGNILELMEPVADQYIKRGYLKPYVARPEKIRPAPLPEAERRITKVVIPPEPETDQKPEKRVKRSYIRRKGK